jgi:ribosomal protein S19
MGLIKKLREAKKEAGPNQKPAMVKTHLRDMIIVPEMIGSVVGVYVSIVFGITVSWAGGSFQLGTLGGHLGGWGADHW